MGNIGLVLWTLNSYALIWTHISLVIFNFSVIGGEPVALNLQEEQDFLMEKSHSAFTRPHIQANPGRHNQHRERSDEIPVLWKGTA